MKTGALWYACSNKPLTSSSQVELIHIVEERFHIGCGCKAESSKRVHYAPPVPFILAPGRPLGLHFA